PESPCPAFPIPLSSMRRAAKLTWEAKPGSWNLIRRPILSLSRLRLSGRCWRYPPTATNKLFILDTASSTPVGLLIKGATAAAFSPDGLKAFIVASNPSAGPPCTASGSCTLYVYSAQAPLQTIDLADPTLGAPTDVAFLTTGSYGYIARGSGISFLATCDDPGDPANPLPTQVGSVSAPGSLLRALPDGQRLLAWSPPNVSTITAAIGGTPNNALTPPQIIGCPAPYLLTSPPPSDPFGT